MTRTNSKASGPYSACGTSKDDPPYLYGVDGPGDGIGYHAWLGHPENTFTTREEAEKAARLMNIAFKAGMAERSRQFREVLNG